jgi:hypothetical protein
MQLQGIAPERFVMYRNAMRAVLLRRAKSSLDAKTNETLNSLVSVTLGNLADR